MRISFRRRRSYGGLLHVYYAALREIWVPRVPPMRRVSSGSCVAMTRIDGFADQDEPSSGGRCAPRSPERAYRYRRRSVNGRGQDLLSLQAPPKDASRWFAIRKGSPPGASGRRRSLLSAARTLPAWLALTGRSLRSRAQQRLDRAALVHRAVALRHLLQRQGQVEDLAGGDLPVPDQVDKLGQEAPHRGGTAVQVHMREEELLPRDLHVVEHADEPDVTACPRAADGLHHRLLRADGLDDRVRAEPAGEFLDPCRALLAALGHDLGRVELPGEPLAGLVPAHCDDPLRAELLGGEHREQADGTVANDRHRLAWSGLGRYSAKPAGAEHVGGREQAGDHLLRRQARRCYEGAVGERDAGVLCLCAGWGTGLPVDAGRVVAGPADLAGVVGGEERADDELAQLDQTYLAADLLDNADVFMAHWGRPVDRRDAAVGPEVRAAHAGERQSDEGVGLLDDRRVGTLLEAHVPGAIKNCSLHDLSPSEYRVLGRVFDERRPRRRCGEDPLEQKPK